MTWHYLDANMRAADAHYERADPVMVDCDDCDGTGLYLHDEHDTGSACPVCCGEGVVPADNEERNEP